MTLPVTEKPTRASRFGRFGEDLAATHLEAKGYRIIERNWNVREGEIDLIATKRDEIVFVEVRSRRGSAFGTPEESITGRKASRLRAAVARYLDAHPDAPEFQRIDVVAVELDARGRLLRVEHIESAIEDA